MTNGHDLNWRLLYTTAAISAVPLLLLILIPVPSCSAIEEPDCTLETKVKWSMSADRLTLSGGGCITLTEVVKELGSKGPLYYFNKEANATAIEHTGTFFLESDLYIEENVRLDVIGSDYGGDVSRLLLTSSAEKTIKIRAYGGQLMIKGVKIRSLDRSTGTAHKFTSATTERSYISAISEVQVDPNEDCAGAAKSNRGEARMDIIDSKISQLGSNKGEGYGVSYKVRGLCTDLSNSVIMDKVSVWGDIAGSTLAYNYHGYFGFGHKRAIIRGNEVSHNFGNGLHPTQDSDEITIANNKVLHNGMGGIVSSKGSDHVIIKQNLIKSNDGSGIELQRSCDSSTIAENMVYFNAVGVVLDETFDTTIHGNKIKFNPDGLKLTLGSSKNNIHHNLITTAAIKSRAQKFAISMYAGSGQVRVEGNDRVTRDNDIHANTLRADEQVLEISSAEGNSFTNNSIEGKFSVVDGSSKNMFKLNEYFLPDKVGTKKAQLQVEHDFVLLDARSHRFGMVVLNGSCFTDDPDSDLGWKSPFACKEP